MSMVYNSFMGYVLLIIMLYMYKYCPDNSFLITGPILLKSRLSEAEKRQGRSPEQEGLVGIQPKEQSALIWR